MDIEWWSDEALILARYSGAVLVADISSLTNLLGESPEWFEASPQVQQAHHGGFISLEVLPIPVLCAYYKISDIVLVLCNLPLWAIDRLGWCIERLDFVVYGKVVIYVPNAN